jgi:O-antigen/teichoic acid export membrane protein
METDVAGRGIVTNATALLLSQVASRAVAIVYVAALARYVGPVGIGRVGSGTALCGVLALTIAPGLDALVIRDIAADHRKAASYLANGLFIRLMLGMGFLLLVWIVSQTAGYSTETVAIVRAYGFVYLLDALSEITAGVFRGFERMEFDAFSQIVRDFANFLLSLAAIYLHQSLLVIVLVSVAAQASRLLLLLVVVRFRYTPQPPGLNLRIIKKLLVNSLPFGILLIAFTMRFQIGVLVLSLSRPVRQVGLYTAAQTLLLSLLFLPASLQAAIEPVFSRLYSHTGNMLPQFYQLWFKLFMLMGFPLAVGSLLVGGRIISLVYGAEFVESFRIWRVLGIYLLTLPAYANGPLLRMTGKQNIYAKVQGLAVVGYGVLCLLLVPTWGADAAAAAFVAGEVATFLVTSAISHRSMGLRLPLLAIVQVSTSTLLMGLGVAIALALGVYWPIVVLLVAPLIFVCSNALLHTVKRSEMQLLRSELGVS